LGGKSGDGPKLAAGGEATVDLIVRSCLFVSVGAFVGAFDIAPDPSNLFPSPLNHHPTMATTDSTLDGAMPRGPAFPSTHWSVVLAAGDAPTRVAEEALEKLCRI
jgi:hypothetical protein